MFKKEYVTETIRGFQINVLTISYVTETICGLQINVLTICPFAEKFLTIPDLSVLIK